MLCPNCKKEIENGSKFCEHCGARVKKSKKWLWITVGCLAIVSAVIVVFDKISTDRQYMSYLQDCVHQESQRADEYSRKWYDAKEGYIDLGLPSGTLWRQYNEDYDQLYYTYDKVLSRLRFRDCLPTKEQFEELKYNCSWLWRGSGYQVTGPNGNSIYLPAAGGRYCDGDVYYVGTDGRYWSSTPYDSGNVWNLYFSSSEVNMNYDNRCFGRSVRLVMNP